MKSKKFDATEKHFEKLRLNYEAKIKLKDEQLNLAIKEIAYYKNQCSSLESENSSLKNWVERLLQYTELSIDDIKKACEKDKKSGEALALFNTFFNGLNQY